MPACESGSMLSGCLQRIWPRKGRQKQEEGEVGPGLRAPTLVFEGSTQGLERSPGEQKLWRPQSLGRIYETSLSRPFLFIQPHRVLALRVSSQLCKGVIFLACGLCTFSWKGPSGPWRTIFPSTICWTGSALPPWTVYHIQHQTVTELS